MERVSDSEFAKTIHRTSSEKRSREVHFNVYVYRPYPKGDSGTITHCRKVKLRKCDTYMKVSGNQSRQQQQGNAEFHRQSQRSVHVHHLEESFCNFYCFCCLTLRFIVKTNQRLFSRDRLSRPTVEYRYRVPVAVAR
jgi:hypothetical protein